MAAYDWVTGAYGKVARGATAAARAADRAFDSGLAPFDEPGEEIKVSPFRPGEVTPEAGVIKAITRLAAGRQAVANKRAKDAALLEARKKAQLETQVLQQRLDAGTRTARTLPGGQTVEMTPGEFANYQTSHGPKKRVPLDPDLAQVYGKYLQTYNPQTNDVDPDDLSAAVHRIDQEGIIDRATQARLARAAGAKAGTNLAALRVRLGALNNEIVDEGEAAYEAEMAAAANVWKAKRDPANPNRPYEPDAVEYTVAENKAKQARRKAIISGRKARQKQLDEVNTAIDAAAFAMTPFERTVMGWMDEDEQGP